MGTVLVVDGADVCRAPIMEFTLRTGFAGAAWLGEARVLSRGLEVKSDTRMCEVASARLGRTAPAVTFSVVHRARPLTREDLAAAQLILTAEREHRSSVVRLLPGTQTRTFTWKEARVLATLVTQRVTAGRLAPPTDLESLARLLHAARGTIPVLEPPVRTGVFHWRKPRSDDDPLSVADGHDTAALHRHTVGESRETGIALAGLLVDLARPVLQQRATTARQEWWRQGA